MHSVQLQAIYDSRNSFYGKAEVRHSDTGVMKLYSYGTLVAEIEDDVAIVHGLYSATTLRHIREFLKQNGFKADTKADIEKYKVKEA